MKKLLIITILLFVSSYIYGQDFGDIYTIGNLTKKEVKTRILKDIAKGRFNKGVSPIIKEISDTLIYEVNHTNHKFTLKITFNLTKDSSIYYCDYVQYIFHCEDWSIKHFKQFKSFFNFYEFNQISKTNI